jgi:hypothetical protein
MIKWARVGGRYQNFSSELRRRWRTKGPNVMTDATINQIEEEIATFEVSDEALEATAQSGQAGIYTLGYCSGLSVCPA